MFAIRALPIAVFLLLMACGKDPVATEHPFVPGGGSITLAGLDDCLGNTVLAETLEDNDKLQATVNGGSVAFVHSGAVLNCCLDSLGLEMYSWGSILRIVEHQHCDDPCDCTCEYTVYGEIGDLDPGYYSLEICSDSLAQDVLCAVSFRIGE